jgi:hypothetical protein
LKSTTATFKKFIWTQSHTAYGVARFFYSWSRKKFLAGLLIGMAPDLLSFGVFHLMHPSWITARLAGEISGTPALSILPPYVFHAYNLTHSLVVFAASFTSVRNDRTDVS